MELLKPDPEDNFAKPLKIAAMVVHGRNDEDLKETAETSLVRKFLYHTLELMAKASPKRLEAAGISEEERNYFLDARYLLGESSFGVMSVEPFLIQMDRNNGDYYLNKLSLKYSKNIVEDTEKGKKNWASCGVHEFGHVAKDHRAMTQHYDTLRLFKHLAYRISTPRNKGLKLAV
jgi:hypothetical protein